LVRTEGIIGELDDKYAIAAGYRKLCELTEADSSNLDSGVTGALHKAKNRLAHDILSDTCRTPRYLTPCRAGSLFASIAADGAVAPCELLADKLTLGNLRDFGMDFLELWNSANAQYARDQIKRTKCH
jgi:MoaA/NifB/PqqE/SkfB family radical SAM enzyme